MNEAGLEGGLFADFDVRGFVEFVFGFDEVVWGVVPSVVCSVLGGLSELLDVWPTSECRDSGMLSLTWMFLTTSAILHWIV